MPTYMVSGRFLAPFLRHSGAHLDPFWRAFSNKNRKNAIRKIMKKNGHRKARNFTPKGCQNDPEINVKTHKNSMQKQVAKNMRNIMNNHVFLKG